MKYFTILFLGLIVLNSCSKKTTKNATTANFTQYVNPFIGTSKMGHVFPGATTPFGMVQLSPQTNFEVMFNEDKKGSI